MAEIPTYLELKYANSSKIFEAEEILNAKPDPQQLYEAEKLYYMIVEKLEAGEEMDEGFFGGLLGGTVGALAGPAIGKAICKVLGIDQNGTLGKLFTSRLVTTAMGIALGK
jgi:hypothetical protein